MNVTSLAVPVGSALIALGVSLGTIEALADDTTDVVKRVTAVEIKQAEAESSKVMIAQNAQHLARLEVIVEKIATQQIRLIENTAAICASTDANCK
tara:strand:- start:867 stop:1154 length:288 start_codon:yes stop_codon:yes gene_type:complete